MPDDIKQLQPEFIVDTFASICIDLILNQYEICSVLRTFCTIHATKVASDLLEVVNINRGACCYSA